MFTDPVTYYFIKNNINRTTETDMQSIYQQLGIHTASGYGLKRDDSSITISYDNTNVKSVLSFESNESDFSDKQISKQLVLKCEKIDNVSVNLLKGIVKGMGYRIFNPQLESYTAVDPNLTDLTTGKMSTAIYEMFRHHNLVPIYRYINSVIFYGLDPTDKSVHLINPHLLQSAIDMNVNYKNVKNFSVKVADDVAIFTALSDRGMIPTQFYKVLFQNSDTGLHINLSGFNIDKIETDLFLSPVFFYLDRTQQTFVSLNAKKNLTPIDKLEKGQSIKTYVDDIIKKHKIEPLIAVKYPQNVEFHTDNNQNALPRLNISIFVDQQ